MKIIFALVLLLLSACQSANELEEVTLSSTSFPPDTVGILIDNYRPQQGNALQNIFISNFSVKASKGQLQWSTSRDGLPDAIKKSTSFTYGFSFEEPESVVTGFSDLFIYTAGINISQYPMLSCGGNQMGSLANDMIVYNDSRLVGNPVITLGLRDCQKSYMSLNLNTFDHNNNGIPDYYEIRCGLNPLNPNQAFTSTAGDGVANIDKCKLNIPIDESVDTESNKRFAYNYKQQVKEDGSLQITVDNIPVLKKGAENFIVIYITETNLTTNQPTLISAFAILKEGYIKKIIPIEYWAVGGSNLINQEIIIPEKPANP